ncbi:hypothetical protein [Halochromatium roseum]|uniref:hypothetical protein n=1 Tax=Halochromatium roseum TaxID=391920 RepID=UPI001912DD25|nr:hypothetical protein [Halochromatium roseum]
MMDNQAGAARIQANRADQRIDLERRAETISQLGLAPQHWQLQSRPAGAAVTQSQLPIAAGHERRQRHRVAHATRKGQIAEVTRIHGLELDGKRYNRGIGRIPYK